MKEKILLFFNSITDKFNDALSEESVKKFFAKKKNRVIFTVVASLILVILTTLIAGAIYVGDYYRADDEAIAEFTEAFAAENASVTVEKNGMIIARPKEAKAGLIFYPGGKVEHSAYLPLMLSLAEEGILCVLVPMPMRLAVLDVNAADGIPEMFPEVDSWYIGGHSLGGSMAASYISKNTDKFDGLVLLASYSTADVSGTRVLSMYGTEDGVMNQEKYSECRSNLPIDRKEVLINGGNHAYFGMYGEQDGDGVADITPTEQIRRATYRIADFILQ